MAFGLISATWGVGLATGPLVNLIPFKGYTIPMIVSMCSSSCCFIYTCIVIPESLEDKYKVPFTCGSINSAKNLSVLWYGPKGLSSKILFRRLAICVCVNAMLLDGIGNVCEAPRYRCHLGCILLEMAARIVADRDAVRAPRVRVLAATERHLHRDVSRTVIIAGIWVAFFRQ